MAIAQPSPAGAASAGSDIYLFLQTKKAGQVKGEATERGHIDEIQIQSWHWGLSASSAIGSTMATGRRSYTGLTVVKTIDCATTALMAALANNDEVKEARLGMRKAGGEQVDHFTITLKRARVVSVEHSVGAHGSTVETVTFRFTDVEVEYRSQLQSGGKGGAYTFSDQIAEQA